MNKIILFLTAVFSVFILYSADPASGFDPIAKQMSVMEKILVPYKKNRMYTEQITNSQVVRRPVISHRIVFSKPYTPDPEINEKIAAAKDPAEVRRLRAEQFKASLKTDYATFLLIPADQGFRIDKALTLSQEVIPANDPGGVLYTKFGLEWRHIQTEYRPYTLYLGSDGDFYYFCDANLSVALAVQKALNLQEGPDMIRILADSLNTVDRFHFTSRFAVLQLAALKDTALPYIRLSIRNHTSVEISILPHFVAVSLMNTPAADAMLYEYAVRSNDEVRNTVFQAVRMLPEPRIGLKQLYLFMTEKRYNLTHLHDIASKLKFLPEFRAELQKIYETPHSISEYLTSVNLIFQIDHPGKKTVQQKTVEQIRAAALRSGEVRGTDKFISDFNESDTEREIRLSAEDRVRLIPLEKRIISAPETMLSIASGIELAMFDSRDRYLSPKYIERVRRSGRIILGNLPANEVRHVFRNLLANIENDTELNQLEDLSRMYVKEGKKSLIVPEDILRRSKEKKQDPKKDHRPVLHVRENTGKTKR